MINIITKEFFAVIDTETNWYDKVMSIGVVIADANTFQKVDEKYYILSPEYRVGGMFSSTLLIDGQDYSVCSRADAISDLTAFLIKYGVASILAYNALFDYTHLPELTAFVWRDIMKIAAYRQYNSKIPPTADCWSTGRLKRNYGVESILKLLLWSGYRESHNALKDACDELLIVQLLNHRIDIYPRIR